MPGKYLTGMYCTNANDLLAEVVRMIAGRRKDEDVGE